MRQISLSTASVPKVLSTFAACCLAAVLSACSGSDGDTGPAGPPGPPGGGGTTNTVLEPGQSPPGVNIEIVSVTGGASANSFSVGDSIAFRFFLKKDDGTLWSLSEMTTARMLISGPTFNYQRVIPQVTNVATTAVANSDGSYTYTFVPLPAVYAAPYNDTASFGTDDGELTGQPLLAGTYTIGAYFAWTYTVEGSSFRDVDNATHDFLLGGATTLEKRAVVGVDNCNACHETLQFHGGTRRDVALCVLCHTAGSEDRNDATVLNGTPGVTVDFRVMIHKIHNGAHLPSVLGVDSNPDGTRTYAATPAPYQIVGNNNSIFDFSEVGFPAWPAGLIAMPRDQGHSALPSASQALEDKIRTGVVDCAVCHGDPDGSGPITAPAQGTLYKAQPTKNACGSCHDDINWGSPYTANGQTMPDTAANSNCVLCHEQSGNSLAVADAHTHPVKDPVFNQGVNFDLQSVSEAGWNNGDGTLDPGENLALTFTIKNDAGVEIAPSSLAGISVVVSGPTTNYNLLQSTSIPAAMLTGAQPFTVRVPQTRLYEFVGDSTAALESFTTAWAPHWNVTGGTTSVMVRNATAGGSSTLASAGPELQNYIDVTSASGFARDEYVVIDDGLGTEEYLKIQYVDGNRLWFGAGGSTSYAPGLRFDHLAGASVQETTMTSKTLWNGTTGDYTLNAATGTITEVTEFGAGKAVMVTYTCDWFLPSEYPLTLNAAPEVDETWGEWTGKSIVDGTYSVGIWGYRTLPLSLYGESNSYRGTAVSSNADFLVGSATVEEPYALISSGQTCNACHQDLMFHGGGRRGYEACVLCHAASGAEDRAVYVAANAAPSTGQTINFRRMLHQIHMGEDLTNPDAFVVVGYGASAYPNNFTNHTYEEVVFPAMAGGVKNCEKCHGSGNEAWHQPSDRNHPTAQGLSVRGWRTVCASCHDSAATGAHIDVMTSGAGVESCEVCHSPGKPWQVEIMHETR